MADNYIDLPVGGGGGVAGVSSLNSQTGALTLVAGSGITITPGALTLTIASSGVPALTEGSVVFSDGVTLDQDNANFFWDDTNKSLLLGNNTISYSLPALSASRDTVDSSNTVLASENIVDAEFTTDSPTTLIGTFNIVRPNVAAAKTLSGGVLGNNSIISRVGAADAGAVSIAASYFGQLVQGNAAKSTGQYAGYLTGFHSIDAMGTIGTMADFMAVGSSTPAGVISNRYGIYIEPDTNYVKSNWISGNMVIGGSSYSAPTTTLKVAGDAYVVKTSADAPAAALIIEASSTTSVDGSNTTLAVSGVANATVAVGATNDKGLSAMSFNITRGDGTDEGTLSAMTGANALMFHNSGDAGLTNEVYGFASLLFSQHGTVDKLYDFFSQRVPAGDGVVNTHYGVYISHDNSTPVKNWLSGATQLGGTSFTNTPVYTLSLFGAAKMVNGLIQTSQDVAPIPTVDPNAGDDAVCTVEGTDTAGVITLTTGTANWAAGAQVNVVFATAYDSAPAVVISPMGPSSAVAAYANAVAGNFTLYFENAAAAPVEYKFAYHVIGG